MSLYQPNRIVITLGGNKPGNTPEEQEAYFRRAAAVLLNVIEQGNEIIITYGNGPQIGDIQEAFELGSAADGNIPPMELPECGAMSQGYMGYQLQQAIGAAITKSYKRWHVASIVTQVEVDPDEFARCEPTKPVGPYLSESEVTVEREAHPNAVFAQSSERGWRRLVPSPEPKKIVEAESILNLLDNEFIVIACGGGGIPVVRDYADKGCYKGVPAVIEKDTAGELLAEDCQADVLFQITSVDYVYKNFGMLEQCPLDDLTADEAERLADEGYFGKSSMEPKVRAAIKFVRSRSGRVALIGSLEKASLAMQGMSGTRIHQ